MRVGLRLPSHRHPAVGESDTTTDAAADELPGFVFEYQHDIAWVEAITREAYLARWLTVSSFLTADEATRQRKIVEIGSILDAAPATRGKDSFELPMRTAVFVYRALI